MTADTGAQPPADQGAQGSESGLFDDYVQNAPPELQPYATEMAKEFSKRVDGKLREAADFRKQYEPLAGVEGLTDMDPDDLSALMEFHQIASDEDSFKDWLGQAAEAVGWQPELDEESWANLGRENGWIEDDGTGLDEDDPLVQQVNTLAETIQQLQQQMTEGKAKEEQQQHITQAEQEMNASLAKVQETAGDAWSEEVKQEVINLARVHIDEDDPIAAGWEHYQRLTGGAQAGLVDDKLGQQNGAALNGGAVDTSPPEMSWHDGADPKAAARQRFAAR